MLRIFEGGLFSEAYECLKKEICTRVEKGEKIFLIVPEQQAVTAENEFIEFLPKSAPLVFEVTNFTRLANTAYRERGGIAAEYLSAAKEALIMWKTLKELSPHLKMTEGSCEINSGLVSRALAAASEMKGLSLSANDIAALAEKPEIKSECRLCEKLSDISKIMTRYASLIDERYASAKDDCDRLFEILSENSDLFSDAVFYVSGFTSFTVPQTKVLRALMARCEVVVHLTLSRLTENFFEFSEIKETKTALLLEADKANSEKTVERREAPAQKTNLQIMELSNLLWKSFGKIDNESLHNINDSVKVLEAADTYTGAEFIASDIKRAVMSGARYRDFAVICRDESRYAGILDSCFNDANIPCFISRQTDISQYEAIKLIYAAFSAIRSGFSRENVLSYAKCRFSGIDMDACDEFELYTELWQIEHEQFTNPEDWDMSPLGYNDRAAADNSEFLSRINGIRRAVIAPLTKFSKALKKCSAVRECASALIDFLTDISLEKKLAARAAELSALGENAASEENSLLWRIICSALDSMVAILGDTEIGIYDFENQLKTALSEANIGKLPSYRDVVTVASADTARLSERPHIYLFGVNAGEFPANAAGASYFTDRDKTLLSSLGCSVNDSDIASARELLFFSRAMSIAKKSVSILYFTRDAAYAPTEPAPVIERIADITQGAVKPSKISALPKLDCIYSPIGALSAANVPEVEAALRDAGYGRDLSVSAAEANSRSACLGENVKALLYSEDISLTQSKIDKYLDCPFAYFLGMNIHLSDNERAVFDARNIGTFIHAILENFFTEINKRGISAGEITENEKSEIVKSSAEKYIKEKVSSASADKRSAMVIDRIYKASMPIIDGLCDEFKNCDFLPKFFELDINRGSDTLPSPASFKFEDGGSVDIHGIIDRVDTYKSGDDVYVRVIDYKTGKKVFSPDDIEKGRNLQMFLYLKAIVETDKEGFRRELGVGEGGKIIPAGVIYVKPDMDDVKLTRDDTEAEREALLKGQTRRGMILDDPVSIGAMNEKYIPVKYTQSGGVHKSYAKNLYTAEGWNDLNERISEQIKSISERMRNGDIGATPDGDACTYCKYANICRIKKS